jgi:hypothetical protein
MNQPQGGTLVVRRGKGYVDKVRAYKVLIDGQEVGRIKQDEEQSFPVTPGRHQLQLKLDWVTSPPEVFDAVPGQPVVYSCRPKPNPLSAFIYMTFKKSQYLILERES